MKSTVRCHLVLAVLALSALNASTATATPIEPNVISKGWVWAEQANIALNTPYVPSTTYQYNLRINLLSVFPFRSYSTGTNTVTRTGTGAYSVVFPGLGSAGGTVHVTAYGGAHHCKVASWGPSAADMRVSVLCFAPGGTPTNGMFTALFYKDGSKNTLYANAYVWADQPAPPTCYTPSLWYQFNSRDVTNTICRVSPGEYDVTLAHMEGDPNKGGDIQVTAYGGGPERCKVRYWNEAANNVIARVGCSTASGAPVDARFTASFMRGPGDLAIQVSEDKNEAYYVWADAAPNPGVFYQSNSYGTGTATLEGPSTGLPTGTYRAHLNGVYPTGSTAIVTAYGPDAAHCNVGGWSIDATAKSTVVNVRCYDGGLPVNSKFTLFYTTDELILF